MRNNNVYARVVAVALCVLGTVPTLSATQNELLVQLEKKADEDYTRQVNPADNLASMFPEADAIGIAVAVVPDPLVPRYRRLYDHAIVAMELGMLRNGYVLDRFYLPWNQKLRSTDDSKQSGGDASSGGNLVTAAVDPTPDEESAAELPFHRGAYGLLLFRCDAWRHVEDPLDSQGPQSQAPTTKCGYLRGGGTRYRALYIVTDTSTTGVGSRALRCVVQRIASQLPRMNGKTPGQVGPARGCWPWTNKTNAPQQRIAQAAPAGDSSRALAVAASVVTGGGLVNGPAIGLLSYPVLCNRLPRDSALLVLGPNFSGGVNSMGAASERLAETGGRITDFCLVSSSATDDTNNLADRYYEHLSYSSLALDDRAKILHIMHLVQTLSHPAIFGPLAPDKHQFRQRSTQVAVLVEASTFGNGVCNVRDLDVDPESPEAGPGSYDDMKSFKDFCAQAIFVPFPANIADVRYGLQVKRDQQQRDSGLKLPVSSQHLSLELGAENGSEYPDSRQSGLTSVSTELAMEQILDTLKAVDPPPRFVVVVATDVRDRLFLFDEVRGRLPGAQLIDLEADNLLSHPDFLYATRGALATASSNLTPSIAFDGSRGTSKNNPLSAWSSDIQYLLSRAVTCMTDAETIPQTRAPSCERLPDKDQRRQSAIQVVTLEGFRPVSKWLANKDPAHPSLPTAIDPNDPPAVPSITSTQSFDFAEYGAPLLCGFAPLLWMFPLYFAGGGMARRVIRIVNVVLYLGCAVYAALLLRVAWIIHATDYDNTVLYWTVAMLIAGFAGLMFCLYMLRHASEQQKPKRLNVWVPAVLASAAVVMAVTPLLWLHSLPSPSSQVVDIDSLVRMGLDPASGLAFLLLVATAVIALLYASIVLATAGGIVNRNSTLLRTAESGSGPVPLSGHRGALRMNPFGLLIVAGVAIAAAVVPSLYFNTVRLTVFGQFASVVALFAMTATTGSAALLTCSGIGAARRILAMSQHILLARTAVKGGAGPGTWPLDYTSPTEFPATPVIATVGFGGKLAKQLRRDDDLTQWIQLLRNWIYIGEDDSRHRVAVFTVLATEMSVYQWSIAGAFVCTLASVGTVYLFPIEADRLLLLNLVILAALGVAAGYMATAFQRNELLCIVLCNRPSGRRFSVPLFACITIPFLVFAVAIAIADIPGVVDWGGGLLELLRTLGIHA